MKRELELLRIAIIVYQLSSAHMFFFSFFEEITQTYIIFHMIMLIFLNNISYHNANTSRKRSEFPKYEMVDDTVRDVAQGYYFNIKSIAHYSPSTSYYFIIIHLYMI